MLHFKSFLTEAKEGSKAGAVANTNGVRHELLTAGVLKHMSTYHNNKNPYQGGETADLFNMDDKQLKEHFDKHVANGEFAEKHMPEHYRNESGRTPKEVHSKYTHESLGPEEHYSHFKNAVEHAKQLHKHLEERGYDPKSINHVSWTSVDGNVNSFMQKHGNNPDRKMNKNTDDADLMTTIKDKQGNTKPLGLSLKWGSNKNQAPTAKNNTHKTVALAKEFDPQHHDAIEEYQRNAAAEVTAHNERVGKIYKGGDKAKKHVFDADKEAFEQNPDDTRLQHNIQTAKDSYKQRSQNIAGHLETALNKVKNGKDGHEAIKNFVRNKLQIANPDFVAARAHMTVDKDNNANGHHFEDHSTSLNDHLNNAHHFHIEKNGATLSIHAMDKDGKKLFTHKMWTKHNSRETDGTAKWLHKVSIGKDKHTDINESTIEKTLNSINQMVDAVFLGDLSESKSAFKSVLAEKLSEKMKSKKKTKYKSNCNETILDEAKGSFRAGYNKAKNRFSKINTQIQQSEDLDLELKSVLAEFKRGEDIGKPNVGKDTGFKNLEHKLTPKYGKGSAKKIAGSVLQKILNK
jgi:hypothetical protein